MIVFLGRRQERAICNSQVLRAQKKPWYYEMSVIFSKEAREERARKLKEEATRGRFHGACRERPACSAKQGTPARAMQSRSAVHTTSELI
jgi:hypothetical protein